MKIRGKGTFVKWLSVQLAIRNRRKFASHIPNNLHSIIRQLSSDTIIDTDLVSFSSHDDFEEQILSILSFIRFVGIPKKWTVYSDGSHCEKQIDMLHKFKFVTVPDSSWRNKTERFQQIKPTIQPYSIHFLHYAKNHPLGLKLFYYLNHTIDKPTLFLDSDVLFYEKASILRNLITEDRHGYFLPDAEWGCLDSRFKQKNDPGMYQVNSGFFLINKQVQFTTQAFEFLKSLSFHYEYFSEQTVIHILLNDNMFMPLDTRIFSLSSKDQFKWAYLRKPSDMAIRHYTGPVRHKLWQNDWRWHLQIGKK